MRAVPCNQGAHLVLGERRTSARASALDHQKAFFIGKSEQGWRRGIQVDEVGAPRFQVPQKRAGAVYVVRGRQNDRARQVGSHRDRL